MFSSASIGTPAATTPTKGTFTVETDAFSFRLSLTNRIFRPVRRISPAR